ncbi:ABC transporter substrate-binding protein [Shinella sp. 838]|uniref:ABC transporter substrate-binding protein n=1 Tax=Shinella sp. 838 TaxID=3038164 RepID=UPI00241581FD|nr:ABC transporter substrate-binding protein [Shinella sp. 838]MDG4675880.1 ABC transporter substrate-binding protein [Shinella sp. 838]
MMHVRRVIRGAALVATTAIATLVASQGAMAEEVKVRFSWKLKGEYGFFYLGEQKGIYKDAGVTLKLGEGAGSQAALGSLIQGQEDVVILPGIFAISAIQKGMPVKIIALYQPESPIALISHTEKAVKTPKDLEGKTIAHAVGETGTSYLNAFCEINQVDCSKVSKVQMDSQSRVPQFLQGQVDVVSVYKTNDLPVLEDKTGQTFPTLDMAEYGLAIPGMAVVASDAGIAEKATALKSFLAANAKAIEMTRSDSAAATAALKAVWQAGPSDKVVQRQIEATSASIHAPSSGTPVGWVDEKAIGDALKLVGSTEEIGNPKPASTFFTNELLTQ